MPSFGEIIRQSRNAKRYTLRQLAKLVKIDSTYLSKLENHRTEYYPREDTIRAFAQHLDLNAEELIFLTGRIPQRYKSFLIKNHKGVSALMHRMRKDPAFAQKIFLELDEAPDDLPRR